MRKVKLYIAMSLDGYVADKNGGVSWLSGDNSDPTNMGSYPEFIETIDTVILGYKTYHQIVSELSPDVWAYAGKKSYVLTSRNCENTEEITFINGEVSTLISQLKEQDGKDIWICGGANIAQQCLEKGLVDEVTLSIIPTILGGGVSLFSQLEKEEKLALLSTKSYNGIVDLTYDCKKRTTTENKI